MSKTAILLLITVLTVSSLLMLKVAPASAVIPKPSVPEFTLKLVAHPYDVPPTYEIDPYTGKNVMTQAGYHVENKSIEIVIKNQPFVNSFNGVNYRLFYNVRVKGHFSEEWDSLYRCRSFSRSSEYIPNMLAAERGSEYTIASYQADYPSGSQLDFQVEASTMYEGQVKVYSNLYDFTGHYEPGYVLGETSGWSNTQTITINETLTTEQVNTILVVIVVLVIGAGLVLLVYFTKRKK
jgi:hypothetical protein